MSVYIKGMEMPKACVYRENGHLITCPLYDIDGYCGALNTEASHKENGKLSGCPLVPVPEHGRLGDLDDFAKRMKNLVEKAESDGFDLGTAWYSAFVRHIELTPTIIPADKEGEE